MTTMTRLGVLRTEGLMTPDMEQTAAGPRGSTMYRPEGTPLRNDGIWHHWLAPGRTYRLEWDGTGWHVTCETWLTGHTYRLADADAQFVDALPVESGVLELERDHVYELRESAPFGAWEIYALAR
jgi:hypothetical protein